MVYLIYSPLQPVVDTHQGTYFRTPKILPPPHIRYVVGSGREPRLAFYMLGFHSFVAFALLYLLREPPWADKPRWSHRRAPEAKHQKKNDPPRNCLCFSEIQL